MNVIKLSVLIKKPIELVFDYVTTPAWWLVWYPDTKKVVPYMTHSFQVGETVTETVVLDRLGLIKFEIPWKATENDGRKHLSFQGHSTDLGGADGVITYELSENGNGVLFQRCLEYKFDGIFVQKFEQMASMLLDDHLDHLNEPRKTTPSGQSDQWDALLERLKNHHRDHPLDVQYEFYPESGTAETLIDYLIRRGGQEALAKVKQVLESMPCDSPRNQPDHK